MMMMKHYCKKRITNSTVQIISREWNITGCYPRQDNYRPLINEDMMKYATQMNYWNKFEVFMVVIVSSVVFRAATPCTIAGA
jgi:hypothetical protein